jgi:hypothetical protein
MFANLKSSVIPCAAAAGLAAVLLMTTAAQGELLSHAVLYDQAAGALSGQSFTGASPSIGLDGVTDAMGTFSGPGTIQSALGDLDGDGFDEVVYYHGATSPSPGNNVSAFAIIPDGSGGFVQDGTNIGKGNWGGSPDFRPHVGDVGGNGDADFIIYNPTDGTLLARNFILDAGQWGVFPTAGSMPTLSGAATAGVETAVGDVNGDGAVEWVEYSGGNVTVYPLIPPVAGTEFSLGTGSTMATNWGGSPFRPSLGDLDGDGRDEFIITAVADGTWLGRKITDLGGGSYDLGDTIFTNSSFAGGSAIPMVGTFVPEPASMAFLALGGLAMLRRRR